MKGFGLFSIPILIAIAVMFFFVGSTILPSGMFTAEISPTGYTGSCQLIVPEYTHAECLERVSHTTTTVRTSGFIIYSFDIKGVAPCSGTDKANTGIGCNLKPINGPIYYKVCDPNNCGSTDPAWVSSGFSTAEIGTVINIPYGKQAIIAGKNIGDTNVDFYYDQKYLKVSNPDGSTHTYNGCDLKGSLSTNEQSFLPTGSDYSLNPPAVKNWIYSYKSTTSIGNLISNPSYGYVICQPIGNSLYGLKKVPNTAISDPLQNSISTGGRYNYANGCFYIPDPNYVSTNSLCCPGTGSISGQSCNWNAASARYEWVAGDKGICVRGGIADINQCPGQGGWNTNLVTHESCRYVCNSQTGTCDKAEACKIANCDPNGNVNCGPNQYCDAATLKCVDMQGTIKQQCSFACCPSSWTQYYQKECTGSGEVCKEGVCVPAQKQVDLLGAVLAGFITTMILGVAVIILSFVFPFLSPVRNFLLDPKNAIIIVIVGTLLFGFVFAGVAQALTTTAMLLVR